MSGQSALRRALEVVAGGAEAPGELLAAAFGEIMDGEASAAAMAALLVALRTRGETVAELAAVARALRARAETAPLSDPRTLDTCGTGGDGAGTFNISTIAAFAVAGAGVPVAKHGNRAASSRCGSADLLEALGVAVDLPVAASARVLEEVGIGFFFARRAHPAMRHVAEVRQQLGIRTLMNCMGPLLNPVGAKLQLVGVYDAALVAPIAQVLGELGGARAGGARRRWSGRDHHYHCNSRGAACGRRGAQHGAGPRALGRCAPRCGCAFWRRCGAERGDCPLCAGK